MSPDTTSPSASHPAEDGTNSPPSFGWMDAAAAVVNRKWSIVSGSLLIGLAALGITYVLPPTFTARTVFLPPQSQQNSALAALSSLGNLAGLAGGVGGTRSPGEQYVSLMTTRTLADRIIERFGLLEVYDEQYRVEARKQLFKSVRIALGRKDGLITVEVDDRDSRRAADMANAYVDELGKLTATLAVTEAQQRRAFFERQLSRTQESLIKAQQALEARGFSSGALRAEPKAAAESYARLRAEAMAAEVRLQMLRGSLVDGTPEVQRQVAALSALRAQLAALRSSGTEGEGPDYIGRYREFKYQETLFELFSRQYEMARVDEAREGALIQVVEVAEPPEKRSKPKRAITAIVATLVGFIVLATLVVLLRLRDFGRSDPTALHRRQRWQRALKS